MKARHRLIIAGHQDCRAGQVRTLLPKWRDDAETNLFYLACIQLIAPLHRAQHLRRKLHRRHGVQSAVSATAAARRAYMIKYIGINHRLSPNPIQPIQHKAMRRYS
ncbi:hypothetical protein D9M71_726470 [compost metagenome]